MSCKFQKFRKAKDIGSNCFFGGLKCKNPDDKSEFVMYGIWKPRLNFQEMDKKKELSLFFGNNGHVLSSGDTL